MSIVRYTSFLWIAVILLSALPTLAQFGKSEADSNDTDTATFFFEFKEHQLLEDTLPIKEPLHFYLFQRSYYPTTAGFPDLAIGNPGHAIYSPIFSSWNDDNINSTTYRSMYNYFTNRDRMKYFRNRPPYTSLYYMQGPKKEEMIDVEHNRNFGKNVNFALRFKRHGSEGFYNNLKTRTSQFHANINYTTQNQRYGLITYYYYNKKELEENGGYEDFNSIVNPETQLSSRLSRANNDIQDEGFLISQSLGIGNQQKGEKRVIPLFRIGHDFELTGGKREYRDEGDTGRLSPLVYQNIYFDSLQTFDTVRHFTLANQANLTFYPGKTPLKFYYRYEWAQYNQNQFLDTIYENHLVGSEFSLRMFQEYRMDISGYYGLEGFRQGDLHGEIKFERDRPDSLDRPRFISKFHYDLREPQFIYQRYISNNFIWNNNFTKAEKYGFNFTFRWQGLEATADIGIVNKFIYYDNNALPAQYDERITYVGAGLMKLLNWKNLYLDNRLYYQNFSNDEIIPMPELMVLESAYYQNRLFKKVLLYQIGVDLYYYTGHNGLAYMPATSTFHLQNTQRTGDYPFMDLFINFQLKRAFFFVKLQHVNKGLAGENFFQIPGYPVQPRAFKWGLKWTLFD